LAKTLIWSLARAAPTCGGAAERSARSAGPTLFWPVAIIVRSSGTLSQNFNPKTKGLGGHFSMKFGFHRESADSVKIMVFFTGN